MSSTNLPSISVVIPCYNAERYIAAAIESVLAQNWPELEIIVVDDGSKDASSEIVRQRFPDVKLISQANQGVAVARNTGIAASQGDWIAFLDADDLWLPGKLQAQWRSLESTPSVRLGYTAWQTWVSSEPAPTPSFIAELNSRAQNSNQWDGPSGWIYPQLLLDCSVWTSTVLVQRSLLQEIGVFDPALRIGEDYDLWLRASRITAITRLKLPTALYRQHPSSITQTVPTKNYQGEVLMRAIAQWGYASPDGRQAVRNEVNRTLAKSWSDFSGAHLDAKNFTLARQGALMAIRADWRFPNGWRIFAKSFLQKI